MPDGQHVPPGMVRLRCVTPSNHWDPCVGIGHKAVQHDDDGCVTVPVGEHANALLRAGYVVAHD